MSQPDKDGMEEFPITVCYKKTKHSNLLRKREPVYARSEHEARRKVLDIYLAEGYTVTKIEIEYAGA